MTVLRRHCPNQCLGLLTADSVAASFQIDRVVAMQDQV